MPQVRELPAGESHLAAAALLELRPHYGSAEAVAERVAAQRAAGLDDLVTHADRRSRGHADAVMEWVERAAAEQGCGQLHLDSGVGPERADAHRFYFRHGLIIGSHHFAKRLG